MIVDLDVLNIGELFEVRCERTRNGVQRAIGLAGAAEIDVRNAVGVFEFTVAGETIEHQGKSLIALDAHGTSEVFIKDRTNDVARRWDIASGRNFIGKLTADQPVVVGEIHIDLHI